MNETEPNTTQRKQRMAGTKKRTVTKGRETQEARTQRSVGRSDGRTDGRRDSE